MVNVSRIIEISNSVYWTEFLIFDEDSLDNTAYLLIKHCYFSVGCFLCQDIMS